MGFENDWYPIATKRELGKKPKGVRLPGNDLVLFRDCGRRPGWHSAEALAHCALSN